MKRRSRRKLSVEISALTILSSVCAVLILGSALIMMFMFFFSQQAKVNMQYYLSSTLQQFDDKIGYIKDGAISIRHNVVLDAFFHEEQYQEKEVQTQLTYCFDLFSQRNIVGQNTPIVEHVYLFNNKDDFVRSSYYPTTLAAMQQIDAKYKQLQQEFSRITNQYYCYPREDQTDICFRVLDDDMKTAGICIVSMRNTAIAEVFSGIEKYKNSCWLVSDSHGITICGVGNPTQMRQLTWISPDDSDLIKLDGYRALYSTLKSGFGMKAAIAIEQSNIYAALQPMVVSFVLVLIIVLAVVTALVFAVSYKLTKPLKQMAEEIGAFAQEDLTMRMGDCSIQEFYDISMVLNEMVERIDRLVTQVYEKELLATRAQMKFLQAQINPHFQFNILAMLSVKARLSGNEELYQGLRAFSKLIQGKIFREKEIKIPLAEEMELVEFYLYLQKSRFQDKISYEVIYGSEDVKNCLIPRLFIEPLVENAVSHGLEPKIGNGHIRIEVYEQADKLHIIVEDDGVGFDPETQKQDKLEKSDHTSTGLANTKRLLEILYKDAHEMTVQGAQGQGVRVEFVLPVERSRGNVESYRS